MRCIVAFAVAVGSVSSLRMAPVRMQVTSEAPSVSAVLGGKVVPTGSSGWQTVVQNAQGRAAAVKQDQDAVTAIMATSTLGSLALPGVLFLPFDNLFVDLALSLLIGCGAGGVAGFGDGAIGDALRSTGRTVSSVSSSVVQKLPLDKLPGSGGEGLSMADIKKYGVSGTIAYILTELAFWAVAFPVASTSFYNLNGHWPDFGDGSDRTAVLAFIFAGANIARLVVPLRFGVAFALAPWVDENICQRFGIGDSKDGDAL